MRFGASLGADGCQCRLKRGVPLLKLQDAALQLSALPLAHAEGVLSFLKTL